MNKKLRTFNHRHNKNEYKTFIDDNKFTEDEKMIAFSHAHSSYHITKEKSPEDMVKRIRAYGFILQNHGKEYLMNILKGNAE